MKILHVWSIAGVPSTLAKYQKKLGHETALILREGFDDFGTHKIVENYVPVSIVSGSAKKFKLLCLLKARKFDVIHCHSLDDYAVLFKRFYRRKKVVLTYHGSKIRYNWEERKQYWNNLPKVTVATPDLLENAPEGVLYVPNPVDTDHFTRQEECKPNTALFLWVHDSQLALSLAREFSEKEGLELTVHRRQDTHFLYSEYPRILEQYEYYIDIKSDLTRNKIVQAISVAALQSIAMGIKVYHNGRIHTELPDKYLPLIVAKQWIDVYNRM